MMAENPEIALVFFFWLGVVAFVVGGVYFGWKLIGILIEMFWG